MTTQLINNASIREVGEPLTAGSSIDDNSDIFDAAGFDSIAFICPITDSSNTGVASLIVEQGDADDGSDAAAVADGTATATSAANDDLNGQLLVVEITRPTKRYVRVNRTSVTANIAFGSVVAIGINPRKSPVDAHTTVAQQTLVTGP